MEAFSATLPRGVNIVAWAGDSFLTMLESMAEKRAACAAVSQNHTVARESCGEFLRRFLVFASAGRSSLALAIRRDHSVRKLTAASGEGFSEPLRKPRADRNVRPTIWFWDRL